MSRVPSHSWWKFSRNVIYWMKSCYEILSVKDLIRRFDPHSYGFDRREKMYRKSNKGWVKHIDFLILDMISLEVAFFLAYMIRHGINSSFMMRNLYLDMIYVLLMIDFISMALLRTFSGVLRRGYLMELLTTIRQAFLVMILSAFYLFTIQAGNDYSRITLVLTGVLYAVIAYITRCLWKKHLHKKKNSTLRSMIVVTTEDDVEKVIANFTEHNYSNIGLTGIALVDTSRIGDRINGIEVVADLDTLEEYVLSHWVDEALFGMTLDRELSYRLQRSFLEMGITAHQSLIEVQNHSEIERNVERIGGYTVITRSIRILTTEELVMKRTLDILGGIVGCILTGLLCLFVGPAIYLASPGPIFFTQNRIGKNGKIFRMYKFRSMYLDAEDRLKEVKEKNERDDDFMFKMENDPRIIGSEKGPGKGIGNFIRKTSIDEFPQFWNVLKGEMSLVGTRPPLVSEWEQYENHHRARMATKPGITGMWQVSGRSDIKDFEEVVDLDMEYIENWSFALDVKILAKTVKQVMKHEGAR